jgi:uroporphyrinogen III methyltransferase/synthase
VTATHALEAGERAESQPSPTPAGAIGPTEQPGAPPLSGRCVVVTRPRDQAEGLVALLEHDGARVLVCPVIEIVPVALNAELRAAIDGLEGYDTVIFTSANGVSAFCERLRDCTREPGALASCELVAIGPATALALEERGLPPSIVPEEYVAEGVLAAIEQRARRLAGRRVLLPRAREARSVLPDELRRRGAMVDVVAVYDTVPAAALACPVAAIEAADYVTFTSGSTARHFAALLGADGLAARLSAVRLASIGPVTSAALGELGLPVTVEAAVYSAAGLAAAIAADAAR